MRINLNEVTNNGCKTGCAKGATSQLRFFYKCIFMILVNLLNFLYENTLQFIFLNKIFLIKHARYFPT